MIKICTWWTIISCNIWYIISFRAPPWYLFTFLIVSKKIISPKNTPKHPNDEVWSEECGSRACDQKGVFSMVERRGVVDGHKTATTHSKASATRSWKEGWRGQSGRRLAACGWESRGRFVPTMRQVPLECDIDIAVNGCSWFATFTQKGPSMAMLIPS